MKSNLHEETKWSAQRIGTLNLCAKKYWYRYLQPGGWRADASDSHKEIYRLGLLQNEAAYAGSLLHRYIRQMIAGELAGIKRDIGVQAEAAARLFAQAVEMGARMPLSDLRKGRVKFLRQARGEIISSAEILHRQDQIRACVENWDQLASVLLRSPPGLIRSLLDPPAPLETDVFGFPALLKTDAVVYADGRWTIYDWKSGRHSESDARQAGIYDLFIRRHFKLSPEEDVTAVFVYLPEKSTQRFTFSSDQRDELLWQIREEHSDLALTKKMRTFPAMPGSHCIRCPFQFICDEGKKSMLRMERRLP